MTYGLYCKPQQIKLLGIQIFVILYEYNKM